MVRLKIGRMLRGRERKGVRRAEATYDHRRPEGTSQLIELTDDCDTAAVCLGRPPAPYLGASTMII
jgi:hypothetical protein